MRMFGLVGKPLTHSFSKIYFTNKFQREKIIGCSYENFELQDITELPLLLSRQNHLAGLNVTIPYKEEVVEFLQSKSLVVEQIGACNCIKILHGKLFGYNTDVAGFERSLVPLLSSHHNKALVLGTGGSAKAVKFVLEKLSIDFTTVSRIKTGASLTYEMVDRKIIEEHPLVINTTPLGMHPHYNSAPPIPYKFISNKHLLFDLIYNPAETVFLRKGKEKGAGVSNGYNMLVQQAEESWSIWNNATV